MNLDTDLLLDDIKRCVTFGETLSFLKEFSIITGAAACIIIGAGGDIARWSNGAALVRGCGKAARRINGAALARGCGKAAIPIS